MYLEARGDKRKEAERMIWVRKSGAEGGAKGRKRQREAEGRVKEAQGVWGGWVPPRSGASEVMVMTSERRK